MQITIDTDNPHKLQLDEAVVFNYLKKDYEKKIRTEDYKFFSEDKFAFLPVETLQDLFNLSAYQQRRILDRLGKLGLIQIKLGQSRARYYKVLGLDIINKKKKIIEALNRMSDKDIKILSKKIESEGL